MKMTWKKNQNKKRPISHYSNLPFDDEVNQNDDANTKTKTTGTDVVEEDKAVQNEELSNKEISASGNGEENAKKLGEEYEAQGNKLAEDGNYQEALGKWETAIVLMPERAVLHEQKAQVLLELGESWHALKAATRATELEPTWAEAWITLGRAQLNFGEPDCAIESFDKALAIKVATKDVSLAFVLGFVFFDLLVHKAILFLWLLIDVNMDLCWFE
ncbi:tetratricopeptide repeat 33 [Olea europaea subsp. europaea]|uniref:Tetratricopeptide repeat 33 n=1 Tax=Olea europaea subsp. europaea TaxID=158383 RepID=A0A8S0UZS8_OLEEU|nr:tetratricopeptide repeat 33 [Olea europaea subsp. europaea]